MIRGYRGHSGKLMLVASLSQAEISDLRKVGFGGYWTSMAEAARIN